MSGTTAHPYRPQSRQDRKALARVISRSVVDAGKRPTATGTYLVILGILTIFLILFTVTSLQAAPLDGPVPVDEPGKAFRVEPLWAPILDLGNEATERRAATVPSELPSVTEAMALRGEALPRERGTGEAAPRRQSTTDVLMVPYFAVAPDDPQGLTTLFAVRNETANSLAVRILYLTREAADVQQIQEVFIPGNGLRTFNLRDVAGLQVDADGIARGLIMLGVADGERGQRGVSTDLISGDFFVVDGRGDFGSGGALVNFSLDDPDTQRCGSWSTRFLNGGSFGGSTILNFVVDIPGGNGPDDEATLLGTFYDENGVPVGSFEIYTDLHSIRIPASALVPDGTTSGSLSLEFVGTAGLVRAEHSARDRMLIGVEAVCRDSVAR